MFQSYKDGKYIVSVINIILIKLLLVADVWLYLENTEPQSGNIVWNPVKLSN